MSIPANVVFDRYANLSQGFLSVDSNLPLIIGLDGVALVTAFIAAGAFGPWSPCMDPVSTTWTAIGTNNSTWTAVPTTTTTWTISPYGV